jgi:hypothetical protein
MKKDLGKIKKLDLRNIFVDEAREFTPWLVDNISILSEKIGIDITNTKKEGDVGDFSVDITAEDENTGEKIIIENQLEPTNHEHLGKLITYASGIEAKVVIWIAKQFREEHQQALEWLNENNTENISFFGIKVFALSIDDGRPAVDFEVIVEPNEWQREIKTKSNELDERHARYLEFFSRLVNAYSEKGMLWQRLKARPESWIGFGGGKAGLTINWAFKGNNRFSTEVYIDTGDKDEVKMIFDELNKYCGEIDKKIPGLVWERLDDRRASRIALYNQLSTSIKNLDEKEFITLIDWAIEEMKLFKEVFTPYIKNLPND